MNEEALREKIAEKGWTVTADGYNESTDSHEVIFEKDGRSQVARGDTTNNALKAALTFINAQ